MGVERGGLDVLVPQIQLELAQVHAPVEQMGRVAMPQRVGGDLLADAGLLHRLAQRQAEGSFAEGNPGYAHGRLRVQGIAASGRREYPSGIAMLLPVLAQLGVHQRRKRNVPVLSAFALAHENAAGLHVVDGEVDQLVEPQAAAVHQPQRRPVAPQRDAGEDRPGLLGREDDRQPPPVAHHRHLPQLPPLAEHVLVEHREAGHGLPGRRGRPALHLLEVHDVAADLLLREILGVPAVMIGDESQPAVVGLRRAQGLVLEAQVLGESLQRGVFMVVGERILILFIVSIFFIIAGSLARGCRRSNSNDES